MPTTSGSIAAASTLAMVRTAEARDVLTADLLAAAALTHEGLDDPDTRLPAPTALELWTRLRDQTAFNRAFRRWTGRAPGRWRRDQA